MKFKLFPVVPPDDVFGDQPITIDTDEIAPRLSLAGSFKLAPAQSFLPETPMPTPAANDDPFGGAAASSGLQKFNLAPPTPQDFAGLGDVSPSGLFGRIKLVPTAKSDDYFGEPPSEGPAYGSLRKSAAIEDLADSGEIIESETLYRSGSGFEVRKRVVSKAGLTRTVVSCPGHLVVI